MRSIFKSICNIAVCNKCSCSTSAQTNVQLLATCYLHNNQPYAAYHILKGNSICSPCNNSDYFSDIICKYFGWFMDFVSDVIWREEAAGVPVPVRYIMLSNEPLAWSRRNSMSNQWTKHGGIHHILIGFVYVNISSTGFCATNWCVKTWVILFLCRRQCGGIVAVRYFSLSNKLY